MKTCFVYFIIKIREEKNQGMQSNMSRGISVPQLDCSICGFYDMWTEKSKQNEANPETRECVTTCSEIYAKGKAISIFPLRLGLLNVFSKYPLIELWKMRGIVPLFLRREVKKIKVMHNYLSLCFSPYHFEQPKKKENPENVIEKIGNLEKSRSTQNVI